VSAVPIIRATSCPSTEALARDWSIVILQRYPAPHGGVTLAYLGRIANEEPGPTGLVKLEDPFEYESAVEISGTREEPRVGRNRRVWCVEGLDVDAIAVTPAIIIPLSKLSPKALDMIREHLIPAWEGREHLRKVGGRVAIASSSTRIEAP